MNFDSFLSRRNESGKDHTDHAFFDRNHVTEFELRLIGAAYKGLAWCFLHSPIVAHMAMRRSGDLQPVVFVRRPVIPSEPNEVE